MKKGRFLWSAYRITERWKAGKARNIKGKQLKNSRNTVSKQHVAHLSSPSANCCLRQGKIFRHHNPRKRLFLGIFFLPFLRRRCAWQKKSFEKNAFLRKSPLKKLRFLRKVVWKSCVSPKKSLEKVAFSRKSPLKKLRFPEKVPWKKRVSREKSFEKNARFSRKVVWKKCAFLLQPIVFATTAGLCVLYKVLLLKFGLKMACMCGGILVL